MEDSRKKLKIYSILVLAFGLASLLNVVLEVCFGSMATVPEGTSEDGLLAAKIMILVIAFITLLPHLYVGLKGISIAKKPTASTTHIKWAIVLIVIAGIAAINPIIEIIKSNEVTSNISTICNLVVDSFIYYEYIRYARLVAKEN